MKFPARALCFFLLFAATAAAQTHYPQGLIQHVIVVVQENRTPDNLFGSNPGFLTGANLQNTGNNLGTTVNLGPTDLSLCYDIGHANSDWVAMWDNAKLDGAKDETYPATTQNCTVPSNPPAPFAYVRNDNTTKVPNVVQPYLDIASQFGFANYMFQTNQGPSFPAHQFLFSGTSAPDTYPTTYYNWFAAENPTNLGMNGTTGCAGGAAGQVADISTLLTSGFLPYEGSYAYTPPQPQDPQGADPGWPCYSHRTMADVLGSISWKYYTQNPGSLWTAPAAIYNICQPQTVGGGCTGTVFGTNVVSPTATVLKDIYNCALPAVSWVTPDGAWSDHAGSMNQNGNQTLETQDWGPSWVADIVNAIGNGIAISGVSSPCNPPNNPYYWKNTVILVTWDDWGGWYDHVLPPDCTLLNQLCTGYSGGNGNGIQYVYGFRVPLLVVSAYSKSKGYVSGSWNGSGSPPTACPSNQYCHDFGSILNFIEYVFGSGGQPLGQIGSMNWPYADHFAMDAPPTCTTCSYSLSDFFNFNQTANLFTQITSGVKDASFFVNYNSPVQDPDDDGVGD